MRGNWILIYIMSSFVGEKCVRVVVLFRKNYIFNFKICFLLSHVVSIFFIYQVPTFIVVLTLAYQIW